MTPHRRPISVLLLACLYIAVGAVGFVAHFRDLRGHPYDGLTVELLELVAVVSGAFLLRGRNWARWLALAWIVFHVILSAFHPWQELAIHSLFCVVIIWILFRPEATRYFRDFRAE